MSRERLEELLWLRADEALDREERDELQTLLAVHPDAQRLEREIEDLARRLSGLPRVAAPPELRERIAHALATSRPPRAADAPRPPARHLPATRWRDRLLPLAAGLVLGAAVTQLLHLDSGRVVDGERAVGTMQSTPVGRAVEVDLGSGVGSVRLNAGDGTVDTELRLVGDTAVVLALGPGAGELRLLAASHAGGEEGAAAIEGGRAVLRARGPGLHRLSVAVPGAQGRLRLEVTTSAGAIVERWVEVGPTGGTS